MLLFMWNNNTAFAFFTNSVWDFKIFNGNANVAVWWEALHHRIDIFFISYFMHAFNKYPQTNNWIHFHGMRGVSMGPAGMKMLKRGGKNRCMNFALKFNWWIHTRAGYEIAVQTYHTPSLWSVWLYWVMKVLRKWQIEWSEACAL